MTKTILKKPIITEKAMKSMSDHFYTFEVEMSASKHQVKEAVERQFSVTVRNITMTTRPGKSRRVGRMRTSVATSPRKFAHVKIGEKETIDVFSVTPESTK